MSKEKKKAKKHKRQRVERVLPGMKLHPLDPGVTPNYAFVLSKGTDEHGTEVWSYRTTGQLNRHELFGLLTIQAEMHRELLLDEWEDVG